MYVIYSLMDPRDDSVFYVGISNDVFKRYLQHITCDSNNMRKNIIITELRADNRLPILEELERMEGRDFAEERETYWIGSFLKSGDCLTNVQKSVRAARPIQLPARDYHTNPYITKDDRVERGVLELYKQGGSQKMIARKVGVSQATVSRIISKHR